MAASSEAVVRAFVLDHHGRGAEGPRSMHVEIRAVLKGQLDQRRVRVWGSDGALCRPPVREFPPGTEWVFALNGPGSKPGVEGGWAISSCGSFSLRIEGGNVIGNVDDSSLPMEVQVVGWEDFTARLSRRSGGQAGAETFTGEVLAGQRFERPFGGRFLFALEPDPWGWLIVVRERGRDEDLARLSPPLHAAPNPREIAGWHFRNADNTGPNQPGKLNVNAPGTVRDFVFSPEVGVTIQGPSSAAAPSPEDIAEVGRFGRGTLTVLELRLGALQPGVRACIAWMKFSVQVHLARQQHEPGRKPAPTDR